MDNIDRLLERLNARKNPRKILAYFEEKQNLDKTMTVLEGVRDDRESETGKTSL